MLRRRQGRNRCADGEPQGAGAEIQSEGWAGRTGHAKRPAPAVDRVTRTATGPKRRTASQRPTDEGVPMRSRDRSKQRGRRKTRSRGKTPQRAAEPRERRPRGADTKEPQGGRRSVAGRDREAVGRSSGRVADAEAPPGKGTSSRKAPSGRRGRYPGAEGGATPAPHSSSEVAS